MFACLFAPNWTKTRCWNRVALEKRAGTAAGWMGHEQHAEMDHRGWWWTGYHSSLANRRCFSVERRSSRLLQR